MFDSLCFFSIDTGKGINYAQGGINQANHNGYVMDCSSLGADVIPGQDTQLRAVPIAKKTTQLAIFSDSANGKAKGGPASFYSSMN